MARYHKGIKKQNIEESRCPRGLNREVRFRPARSRHCIGEQCPQMSLDFSGKARQSDEPEPGELPVFLAS